MSVQSEDSDQMMKEIKKQYNEDKMKSLQGYIPQKKETKRINTKFIDSNYFKHQFYQQFEKSKKIIKPRLQNDNVEDEEFQGPWAVYEGEEDFTIPLNSQNKLNFQGDEFYLKDKNNAKIPDEMDVNFHLQKPKENQQFTPTAIINKKNAFQNMLSAPPSFKNKNVQKNSIPKKLKLVIQGDKQGVQKALYFPKHGNLILSAHFDKNINLWKDGKNLIIYKGHSKSVKDICFSNDGTYFLSSGFDARINCWDTETGKVINSISTTEYPYCIRLNPDPDRQFQFLSANLDSIIYQYDIRTKKEVQRYTDHMGPVNNVIFVDNNKKFVSFGDDKKIFMYEYGVNVIIKNLFHEDLGAIHSSALHPNKNYLVGQTHESSISVFDLKDSNLKLVSSKKFLGHYCSGYGLNLNFSPDGNILSSGDFEGRVFFWNWNSTQIITQFKAHEKVCNGVEWHPNNENEILTYSWDGSIRLWSVQLSVHFINFLNTIMFNFILKIIYAI